MDIKNIDFSSMPKGYKLCFNDKCLLAQKCLRHIAIEQIKDSAEVFQVINHFKFEGMSCKYFVCSENVSIAYGMKGAFENILVSDAKKIRIELIELFGQAEFYRRKNAEKPISPDEQEQIINIFAKFGYTISFDKTIETTFWED